MIGFIGLISGPRKMAAESARAKAKARGGEGHRGAQARQRRERGRHHRLLQDAHRQLQMPQIGRLCGGAAAQPLGQNPAPRAPRALLGRPGTQGQLTNLFWPRPPGAGRRHGGGEASQGCSWKTLFMIFHSSLALRSVSRSV
jgi:hypothetical protein